MAQGQRLAGIELGGTKCIAVLGNGATIVDQASVPTQDPHATLAALHQQLLRWHREAPLAALGIASFGPIALDPAGPAFGTMLPTPKPGWSGAAILAPLRGDLPCPVRIDTDVNGAALAEYRWGAGQGFDSLCYVTIGTGVGAGLLVEGRCVHGAMHPEIGHLRLRRAPGDRFAGSCAFHGDCIEGLVSGPALAKRFGMPGEEIPDDHWQWRHVASDLAELVGAILHTTAPWRIMFGGSVPLARPFLLDQVREIAVDRFASYLPFLDRRSAQDIIGLASLGTQAGPLGALALANEATK